ncbi:hypothetical protein [Blastococcus mobilis]|uniref:Ig-like domain-containing protein n=1 Tax=Blastococcus mobilis TaxID=1938746 RepID=A0A238YPZ4_9ACTN|nr:hypothetical protein [Blastococcus mobilis]SNR72878.1 hypothetical protein SAMN06272737_12180 [Blastococcus mobilis]
MTTTRRILALIGLTLTVIVGPAVPASATFTDSAAVAVGISTGTVAAPGWVSAEVTYCHPVHYVDATVSWPASETTAGVIGYRVTAHFNDGTSAVIAETDSAGRSYSARMDRDSLQFQPRVTVTTLTSHGWTKESVPSAVMSC